MKIGRMPSRRLTQTAILLAATILFGCGGRLAGGRLPRNESDVLHDINALRTKAGLLPIASDSVLESTAARRAEESAAEGIAASDNNRLPTLTAAGAFARFALSHEVSAPSFGEAAHFLVTETISKSKLLHPSLTHMGIGYKRKSGTVYLVIDLARLVPKLDNKKTAAAIQQKLDEKRIRNSLDLLAVNDKLNLAAAESAVRFMNKEGSGDEILADAQAKMKNDAFAFGRMTITFQVVPDLLELVIPERAADPSLAFTGIGIAQGNREDYEAGSTAVVIILAEPQTAHDASRGISELPSPKAALRSKISSDKPLTEQAWTATLTGNHRKAAKLFEQAYKQTKKPMLMYEAARAHARNEDNAAALKDMRLYVGMVDGEEKQKALDMIAKLEKKESIFSTSKDEQLSVEAKRFFVMGQLLFEQKEWDGAVDAFQQAYKFSPTPEIVYNIGLTHYRAGRIGEALNFFGEYQRLVPGAGNVNEARQFFEIGVELYQSGRFDAASKQFAMAYSFLPFPELVYNLGLCYKAMGENDKAVRFFREYLENDLPTQDKEAVRKIIADLSSGRRQ